MLLLIAVTLIGCDTKKYKVTFRSEFHVESENIEEVIPIHDDLFAYRGLDAEDINNFFLVAEYVKLTQR